jgi:DNA polymerase-3 subunit delta
MPVRRQESDYLRIKHEIESGEIKRVYIFTGSEDFLIDEVVGLITAKLLPAETNNVNLHHISGNDCLLDDALDMAETVSLFGGARLVVVKEAPYFTKEKQQAEKPLSRLLSFCTFPEDSSCVIFCATDFLKTKKAHKELISTGSVYYFNPLKPAMIIDWLGQRLAARGKTARRDVLAGLVERVGRDMRRLASELEKLITYLGDDGELNKESIVLATARSLQGDIFALSDAVVSGRTSKALAQLKELLASGEPPLRILAMLVRQFRLLGESLELLQRGCAPDELPARLGIHPYAAEKLAVQAARADDALLCRAVDTLLQVDLDIKHGRVDQSLALETLVVALGRKSA